MAQKVIYLIGSLRNPEVNRLAAAMRTLGFEVFDDWTAAGPTADDSWRDYEKQRGHSYVEALQGYAARHVFAFDMHHLIRCDLAVCSCQQANLVTLNWATYWGRENPDTSYLIRNLSAST